MSEKSTQELQKEHQNAWISLRDKYTSTLSECDELRRSNILLQEEIKNSHKSEKLATEQLHRARSSIVDSQYIISNLISVKDENSEFLRQIDECKNQLKQMEANYEKCIQNHCEEKRFLEKQLEDSKKELRKEMNNSRVAIEISQSKFAIHLNEMEEQVKKQHQERTMEVNDLVVDYENKILHLTENLKSAEDEAKILRSHIQQYKKQNALLERQLKLAENSKAALVAANRNLTNLHLQESAEKNISESVEENETVDSFPVADASSSSYCEYFCTIPKAQSTPAEKPIYQKFSNLLLHESPSVKKLSLRPKNSNINKNTKGKFFNDGINYNTLWMMHPKSPNILAKNARIENDLSGDAETWRGEDSLNSPPHYGKADRKELSEANDSDENNVMKKKRKLYSLNDDATCGM